MSLHIPPNTRAALVGGSGSGKSTIVGLILRFYDPNAGRVMLDGHPLRSLALRCVRRHIGLVSQEPVLFATTVAANIGYGKEGKPDSALIR